MRRAVALAAVAAALLTACSQGGASSDTPVATSEVTLPKSYRFEPEVIQVDQGTTVTWTNQDDFPHTVHLLDGSDVLKELPIGASASITFDQTGTIDYECSLHPQQMTGSVIVE